MNKEELLEKCNKLPAAIWMLDAMVDELKARCGKDFPVEQLGNKIKEAYAKCGLEYPEPLCSEEEMKKIDLKAIYDKAAQAGCADIWVKYQLLRLKKEIKEQ